LLKEKIPEIIFVVSYSDYYRRNTNSSNATKTVEQTGEFVTSKQ